MSRKPEILKSAIRLFKSQGKTQTSIRQIATVAGVSHSLLHKHWDSKDDLFLDCIESEVSKLRELLTKDCSRAENTLYFLLKHPDEWTLVARCLASPPPTNGEERRMSNKVTKRLQPLLDDLMRLTLCFTDSETADREGITSTQASVAWFFIFVSVFSGHSLLKRSLESYLGADQLHTARRCTIDAFYENWIFRSNRA